MSVATAPRRVDDEVTISVTENEHRILDYLLKLAYESPETFGAVSTVRADTAGRATGIFTASVYRLRNKLGTPPAVTSVPKQVHFLVIYSLKLRRTLREFRCDSWSEALREQAAEMNDVKWRGRHTGPSRDVEFKIFGGPSRDYLVQTQRRYFAPRNDRISR